jgi:hypothetical protein
LSEDILKRAMGYRNRAQLYLKNFEKEKIEGNREKAGEALWGGLGLLFDVKVKFK